MVTFTFSTLDLFLQILPKNRFGILMLPYKSPSSLVAETRSQWLFLFTCSIMIYLSQLSSCWIWHLMLSWVRFLSNIILHLKNYKNILLFAQTVCFDMYLFNKNVIVLHHGENSNSILTSVSNSHIQQ